jgi:uncharacterized RmlC-like cupin family protein
MTERQARVVRQADLVRPDDGQTTGMVREEAFSTDGLWVGKVTTAPNMASGWHHHGEYDTYVYVLQGRFRLEYGPGGQLVEVAGPGEFILIPRGAIHREGSPDAVEAVLFRVGSGPVLVNVDGPASIPSPRDPDDPPEPSGESSAG